MPTTGLCRVDHGCGLRKAWIDEAVRQSQLFQVGDLNYAKEELRAELASVFLMAERGIPHNPDSHAAYLGSWLKVPGDDKHEDKEKKIAGLSSPRRDRVPGRLPGISNWGLYGRWR
jgi:hypothetical protein